MHTGDGKVTAVPGTKSIKAQTTPSRERETFYESQKKKKKKEQVQLPQLQIGGLAQRREQGNVSVQHVLGAQWEEAVLCSKAGTNSDQKRANKAACS